MTSIPNIIVTRTVSDPFARVPKDVLDDTRMSWKAKGILAYLLGKPHDWVVRTEDIVKRSTDGEASVVNGLKELREAGYAKLVQIREGGRVKNWCWKVADAPIF